MANDDVRKQPVSPAPRDTSEFLDEGEMDDALDDTFPASDPPSWTLGVDDDRREKDPAPPRPPRPKP
jgi:hypothetical protein